jgi:protein ImuB
MQKRQIVSIWLPRLAINRWQRQAEPNANTLPTVLTTDGAHGPRITAVNDAAFMAGAVIGQRLVDAKALSPDIVNFPADSDGDRKTLERLTLWVQRWGPWSMMDGHDSILLDVTGASHLCGGAQALLIDIENRLNAHGFEARPAMGETAGSAWALSHYGRRLEIADYDDALLTLGPLPVAALRLDPDILTVLQRLGLKRICDLNAVPRESLARRFRNHRNPQTNPLIRLDQILGKVPEPMIPLQRTDPPLVNRRLIEPILHRSLLDQIINDLAGDMVRELETQRLGARRLDLRAYRVDGDVAVRQLELASATRDASHIVRLFSSKIDTLDAGFGIDQVDLISTWSEPLNLSQEELGRTQAKGTTLPQMLDRIAARLGPDALRRPVPRASHIPERSVQWRSEGKAQGKTSAAAHLPYQCQLRFHERPLKLLEHAEPIMVIYATPEGVPRQFRWRGSQHIITRSEGPERLAPEWWRERSTVRLRDYYRIEDTKGARYWIYRNGVVGDGRGSAPEWFLHGMFA